MDFDSGIHPKMNWESGDLPQAWKSFKNHVSFMFGGPLNKKSEEEKCNYLMIWVGERGRNIFSTWTLSEEDHKLLKSYYDKFDEHVAPKSNVVFSRYKFHSRTQAESETIEEFLTALRMLARDCSYNDPDDMMRDRVVLGTKHTKVREKCIEEGSTLTLQRASEIAQTYEVSQKQLKSMQTESVNALNVERKYNTSSRGNRGGSTRGTFATSRSNVRCHWCGLNHPKTAKCPADGKACLKCEKLGHFASVCKSGYAPQRQKGGRKSRGMPRQKSQNQNKVFYVEEDPDPGGNEELFLGMIGLIGEPDKDSKWLQDIIINNQTIQFQLDTGAKCNVLPKSMLNSVFKGPLARPEISGKIRSYTGHRMCIEGVVTLKCAVKGKDNVHNIMFNVVDIDEIPVLGGSTCSELGLVERVYPVQKLEQLAPMNIDEYKDVFEGLGCLPGTHTIKLKPDHTPVIHPPRKLAVALRENVKAELDRMEQSGVVVRQVEPTDWVNSMTVVVKPHKIRICMDPMNLNQAIRREHFPLKTIEEVIADMPGARVFSKLDARSGFWQICLDDESSKLCTFNTPFGRYRFTRLPFGIKSAPEVFQQIISRMVEDLPGVEAIMDDILVWGTDTAEHDSRLVNLLQRAREYNLKLNREKCRFRVDRVQYVGHEITREGLRPDPEKVRAVVDMEGPKNVKEIKTLLGFIQYLGKFLPNLSDASQPLRILTTKDVQWHWDKEQEDSFQQLKLMATQAPVLAYYDPHIPLTLSVDASSTGLGATLIQRGKPIAYASRALTDAQTRYAQIEKEMLAIAFGCQKFHQYVFMRRVQVETDHKPLQAIFTKPLHDVPLRLQKIMMSLQRYDLAVEYRPGKELLIADHLSRAYLKETGDNSELPDIEVNLLAYLPISNDKLKQFQEATSQDEVLSEVRDYVKCGWPTSPTDVGTRARQYWTFREEMTCVDGLVFKNHKLVVPASLQKDMLNRIHESHLGIVKCKSRARETLFWPGMSTDIENTVAKCDVCAKHQNANSPETLLSSEVPDRPWAKIGTDLFDFQGSAYLLAVDYFSKWPEMVRLEDTTSKRVITHMKSMFARFGMPESVMSDNGPQYSSGEFKKFAEDYNFEHVTSSPKFPQSNGQAERTVQTIKNLLRKASDPYKGLLDYRNSPIEGVGKSPAQLFLGRRLRSSVPTAAPLLRTEVNERDRQSLVKRQSNQQYYHPAQQDLKPFITGTRVMMKDEVVSGSGFQTCHSQVLHYKD